ncbi:MAG: sigma-70 family RNA polymerase sigma factor [Cyanobacteria bacterium J06626_14]
MASDLPPPSSVPSSRPSDRDVLVALQQGQISALSQLYDRHASLIYSLVYRILNDTEDAEDITQDVFLKLWNQPDRYDPNRGSLSSFLVTMARSRAIDKLRRRGSRFRFLQRWQAIIVHDSHGATPLESVSSDERSQLVTSALSELSEKERQVLELSYYDGLSYAETAERLNLPLGTVKSRARSGLRKLRQTLKHSY